MKSMITLLLQLVLISCNGQKEIKMENSLLTSRILNNENSKNIVIFGGSPYRRHEIIELLSPIENLSIHATLSEEEGMAKINELGRINMVLIGGRYSEEQRHRIRNYVHKNYPEAAITEPGFSYAYSNPLIFENVKTLSLKP
ncbi:MAG: hypothetical protein ACRCVT_05940 [Leadbetterella sp.]